MKDICRVSTAEVKKFRRTLGLRLAIWGPMIIILLVVGIYILRKAGEADPLTGFAQLILTLWTIIMFPLYASLLAALLAALEHQNETWKHLLALPVPPVTVFAAKWITGTGLLLVSTLVIATGVSVAAEVLRLVKPGWGFAPLPVSMIFRRSLMSCCAAGFLFSIQMWISLRWRNFMPGLVVAVIALVLMFIAIPHGAALFGTFFPWSLPAMAMAPHNPRRAIAVWLGLLGGVAVAVIACCDLSRREYY
jgi:lantibiotic transport system permease protein